MKDVMVDEEGELRCPSCGGKNFDAGRRLRAKVSVGVGSLLLPKRLKCLVCGEWCKAGDAKPFSPPPPAPEKKKAPRRGALPTYEEFQAELAAERAAKSKDVLNAKYEEAMAERRRRGTGQ